MKLGFIGTGKITSAVVTGICGSKISFKKILLSIFATLIIVPTIAGVVLILYLLKPGLVLFFQ